MVLAGLSATSRNGRSFTKVSAEPIAYAFSIRLLGAMGAGYLSPLRNRYISRGYVGIRSAKSSVDKSSVDRRTLLSDVSQRHELLWSCMVVVLRALHQRSKDIRYRTHAQLAVFGYWVYGLSL